MSDRCASWREILSAQLDGEETAEERGAVQAHLDGCPDCRAWHEVAAMVTRRARTRVVAAVPDLTESILAAVPPPRRRRFERWRGRWTAGLRVALGLLGAVQLALGLAQVGQGVNAEHLHPTGQHLWHESAAWNVAVGAGFLFVALRRTPPAGLLPMLSAFVATLVLLSVNDLVTAQVAVPRLVSHGFLVGGYLITVLLYRLGPRPSDPPQGRRAGRSRWRLRLDELDEPGRAVVQPYGAQARDRRAA
ncbi:zf-HC2 domain-containing protein [Micromonospora antibiotica]|uniref:Zf-HC2 domain-containing protein n=1 Tax=Micromonospora antibiotica TaxID=2807623 RepID=A0ABS3V5R1_9ACTN|nr:zf-HC2 domain-containing protein [Micromonospora antibiotica]MBO4160958.1 zf-HC2 domain-containing protein [Micromonospora antibiotica]